MANSLLSGITEGLLNQQGPLWTGLEERRKREQAQKDEARELKLRALSQAISLPGISQEARDQIGKDIQGLLPPDAKKTHGKVLQTIGGIFGAVKPSQQAQVSQPQVSSQGLSTPNIFGDISKAYGQTQTPKDSVTAAREKGLQGLQDLRKRGPLPGQSQKEFEKELQDKKEDLEFVYGAAGKFGADSKEPASVQLYNKKRQDLQDDFRLAHPDASEEDARKWLAGIESDTALEKVTGVLRPTGFIQNEGTPQEKAVYGVYSNRTGKLYKPGTSEEIPIPTGAKESKPGTRLYANAGTFFSVDQAIQRTLNGEILYGPGGKPYSVKDLEQVKETNPHFTLFPIAYENGKLIQAIGPPQGKFTTIGNEIYAYSQPEAVEGARGTPGVFNPVGQRQVGTDRSATTNLTQGTTETTTTPRAPGVQTPPPTSQVGAPQRPPQERPPQGPQGGGSRRGANDVTVPPGLAGRFVDRYTAVTEAASQVFGSGQPGEVAPFASYKDLAQNKDSQKKLGKALQLTFNGFEGSAGGPNADARLGAFGVSTGKLGDLVATKFGVPADLASAQASLMRDAVKDLSPREKEYYDSVMSAYSTIVGLRSLTRASAAQSSVAAIERELPLIGINVKAGADFDDQLARLARVVYNGMTTPGASRIFSPEQIQNVKQYMEKKGRGPLSSPAVSSPGDAGLREKLDRIFK